ncbi:unnamed protein product, partial [marine sediment metagenome]
MTKLTEEAKKYIIEARNYKTPSTFELIRTHLREEMNIEISKVAIIKWFNRSFEAQMRNGSLEKNVQVKISTPR